MRGILVRILDGPFQGTVCRVPWDTVFSTKDYGEVPAEQVMEAAVLEPSETAALHGTRAVS